MQQHNFSLILLSANILLLRAYCAFEHNIGIKAAIEITVKEIESKVFGLKKTCDIISIDRQYHSILNSRTRVNLDENQLASITERGNVTSLINIAESSCFHYDLRSLEQF